MVKKHAGIRHLERGRCFVFFGIQLRFYLLIRRADPSKEYVVFPRLWRGKQIDVCYWPLRLLQFPFSSAIVMIPARNCSEMATSKLAKPVLLMEPIDAQPENK